jgi:non-heme chloroperoxidase
MSTITTSDGTEIYYKDWGGGPAVTFSHGWPLSADAWDGQMLFLAQHGFRAIAHDRRGHGRSSQASTGNDMNGYADDLADVIEALDLHDVTVVGHSTGCGEVARYIGRHGTARVAKAVLISGVPPGLVKSDANPTVCRPSSSTRSRRAWPRTGPSSTWTSQASSTARTGPAPTSRRA